ncbi:MAG TPA: hypothetical protein VHK06_01735 [Candidatus Limnocylindria bacterium]|nr:hypothetical protein [Candidatus Limnocylindria bacterium]
MVPSTEPIVYCLTRDRNLAGALEERLAGALPFFYNDAARLHQALMLRAPDFVVIDTAAIRPEYGDAGLGPVVAFVRERAPAARVAVKPAPGAERLVAAEAGPGAELIPADHPGTVAAVATACGCP